MRIAEGPHIKIARGVPVEILRDANNASLRMTVYWYAWIMGKL